MVLCIVLPCHCFCWGMHRVELGLFIFALCLLSNSYFQKHFIVNSHLETFLYNSPSGKAVWPIFVQYSREKLYFFRKTLIDKKKKNRDRFKITVSTLETIWYLYCNDYGPKPIDSKVCHYTDKLSQLTQKH